MGSILAEMMHKDDRTLAFLIINRPIIFEQFARDGSGNLGV